MSFNSLDQSNYIDSLNSYQNSFSDAEEKFQKAKDIAQGKVDDFNQFLQEPLETVGDVLVAKGIGKILPRVKKGLNDTFENVKSRAGDVVDNINDKISTSLDNVKNELQSIPENVDIPKVSVPTFDSPVQNDFEELPVDLGKFEDATATPYLDSLPEELQGDSIGAKILRQFQGYEPTSKLGDPIPESVELTPLGDSAITPGYGSSSTSVKIGDAINQAKEQAERNIEDTTQPFEREVNNQAFDPEFTDEHNNIAGAQSNEQKPLDEEDNETLQSDAVDSGTTAVEDTGIEGTLGGVEEGLLTADASSGGLDLATDLATLGVGLGMVFGGIFGKKHINSPPPPQPINPSFQAGI